MNKYNAKKVTVDGITFDSKAEYKRYNFLKTMEKAEFISDLRRQVPYTLVPAQREPDKVGKKGAIIKGNLIERPVTYKADFVYIQNGKTVVEDVKGSKTKDYIIKRKLMLYVHGIRISEVY